MLGLPSDLLSRDHFDAEKAFTESWKALVVEYIDMYLMHWPPQDLVCNTLAGTLPPDESPTYVET